MTKTQIAETAASLNDNQQYALRRLIEQGEDARLDQGKKRLTGKLCRGNYYDRRAIAAPTRRALRERGLIEGETFGFHLSTRGLHVARYLFERWLSGYEERESIEIEEAEGLTFKPATVEEYVQGQRAAREKALREHQAKIKRAIYLWRGLKHDHYGNPETMASKIKESIDPEATYGRRDDIRLDIDDLISIGEGIEAIRRGG